MISSLAAEDPTKTKISQMRTYRRHCPIISGQEPAEVLLELFKAGEHWILVRIDGQSNNVQLITQFDIISQLWRERQQILPVLQTLSADNLVKIRSMPGRRDPAKPLTVLPGAHALVAMKRMLAHGVHCIAVCHEIDGKILADLSTLAVKLAPLQLITSIKEKPVLEFLEMLYQSDEEEGEIPEPLVCLPSTLLETVLLRLVENHSHHSKLFTCVYCDYYNIVSLGRK
jgi:hypothetical protein